MGALYGESFSNGTSKYFYEGSKTLKKEIAMGYYSEMLINKTYFDSISGIELVVASGAYGENKFETHQYYFNDKSGIERRNSENL